jgi:polysaccharide deacetylase 2 family uncharacterized protein YibQ
MLQVLSLCWRVLESVSDSRGCKPWRPTNSFAKANLVLDTVPSAVEIDRALVRLEGMARESGIAVAAALPVTIERIAIWAKRGFTLAPISAAATRAKSS